MYVIEIANGSTRTVIHEAGTSDVKVDDAEISREVNKFDSLTFTIFPENPGFDELTEFSTLVEVTNTKTGKTAFDGRVIQVEPEMGDDGAISKTVTCESVMGYLCDSLQMWAEEEHYADTDSKTGLVSYLEKLLARHNAAVESYKQIQLGSVTLQTFDTSGGVTKGINRASTWSNIDDKLLGVFGGEMRVRRGEDGLLYLDYAESLGTTRATTIEVARNMASAQRSVDPDNVITRFYPFGCKLTETVEDEEGNDVEQETEKRLTIEAVNHGVPYIDDTVAMAEYGIIEGYNEWDDVTDASNLLQKAQQWLGDNNALPVSHTFDAYDLSLIGLDYDSFEIFDSYPCRNPLIGLDETLEVVKQKISINVPENSTIEVGEVNRRLSSDLTGNASKGDVQQVESQQHTAIVNLENRVVKKMASITIDTDAIVSQVTEIVEQNFSVTIDGIDGTIQDVTQRMTELEQNASGWDFNFSVINQQLTELGDQVSTNYVELIKYIRFVDGVIIIGVEGNPLEVRISNSRVSFLQNNVEVAYISNNQLYITEAEVERQLRIGMFQFSPRDNGNLTLRFLG